jgi:hypothetical protein
MIYCEIIRSIINTLLKIQMENLQSVAFEHLLSYNICGCHGDDYEDYCFVERDAAESNRALSLFRRNFLLLFS